MTARASQTICKVLRQKSYRNLFFRAETSPWLGISSDRSDTEPAGEGGTTGLAFLEIGGGGGGRRLNSEEDVLERKA